MIEEGRCIGCGYLLKGLSENRCPECGRAFDPNDQRTINIGRQYGSFARWALQPTGWIAPAAPWVAWGIFAIGALTLFDRLVPFYCLSLCLLVFLAPYAVKGSLRNWFVRRYRQPKSTRAVDRTSVNRIFGAFLLPMLLVHVGVPAHLLFYLSLPSINAFARHAYFDEPQMGPHREAAWAGFYRVHLHSVGPSGVMLEINGTDIYQNPEEPDRPHPLIYGDRAELGGGWIRFGGVGTEVPFNLRW